ncbi:MAG: hypothetical protein ACFFEV_06595 [Candidatus Thorarchaeota archaeon]
MTDKTDNIRWQLDALKTEYNQHWSHFRHAIDKSYQAFNIHMVLIALLFSAISLANDQAYLAISIPLFVVIGLVAYISSEGTISTLVTQRMGYVWNQKVIDVLRERISEKTSGILEPEVNLFYDRKIFNPGTAWFSRVNFVILTAGSVIVLCSYLTLTGLTAIEPSWVPDSMTALILSLFVLSLVIQKMYHSLISRSCHRSRNLFCQLQKYANPPSESREIKGLRRYTQYLLGTEVILLFCTIFFLMTSILFIIILGAAIIILVLTLLTLVSVHKEIAC